MFPSTNWSFRWKRVTHFTISIKSKYQLFYCKTEKYNSNWSFLGRFILNRISCYPFRMRNMHTSFCNICEEIVCVFYIRQYLILAFVIYIVERPRKFDMKNIFIKCIVQFVISPDIRFFVSKIHFHILLLRIDCAMHFRSLSLRRFESSSLPNVKSNLK